MLAGPTDVHMARGAIIGMFLQGVPSESKELTNGPMAMVTFIGMFFQGVPNEFKHGRIPMPATDGVTLGAARFIARVQRMPASPCSEGHPLAAQKDQLRRAS